MCILVDLIQHVAEKNGERGTRLSRASTLAITAVPDRSSAKATEPHAGHYP